MNDVLLAKQEELEKALKVLEVQHSQLSEQVLMQRGALIVLKEVLAKLETKE